MKHKNIFFLKKKIKMELYNHNNE